MSSTGVPCVLNTATTQEALMTIADGPWGRRIGLGGVVVGILTFAGVQTFAPSLAARSPGSPAAQLEQVADAPFNADAVVEEVSHSIREGTNGLEVAEDAYQARFGDDGFSLGLAAGGDFALSLRGFQRGTYRLEATPATWRAEANVATRDLGNGTTERVTARDGELQWDVVLSARPAGNGPLTVRAELRGVGGEATVDDTGLSVPLSGGTSVRVGPLKVLDATGTELHRAVPTVTGHQLTLQVPSAVLGRAVYPLTLDPTIGPERSASPVPALAAQEQPDVASDGTIRLVVWRAYSDGVSSIVGTRVDASGKVLDPGGIFIAGDITPLRRPVVEYIGGNFLVVWERGPINDGRLFYLRVNPDGGLVDFENGSRLTTATTAQGLPALAFDGTNALVVWSEARGTASDIIGARVATNGTVLDAAGFVVSGAAGYQHSPAVSYDGTRYLVGWSDARSGSPGVVEDIYAARVTTARVVLDPVGFVISARPAIERLGDIAWDGANHLAVWTDRFGSSSAAIRAARVTPAGTVLDSTPIALPSAGESHSPRVAFNGTSSQVVWQTVSPGDVYGARVGTDGAVLDSPAKLVGSTPTEDVNPAIAAGGPNPFVVWHDTSSSTQSSMGQVIGTRMSGAGTALDTPGRLLSTRVVTQFSPETASDGANQLIVWSDERDNAVSDDDIYAARVDAAGNLLDQRGLVVAATSAHDGMPGVAFGASQYLVVWKVDPSGSNNADIHAQRVGANGSLVGSAIIVSNAANDQSEPAVVFDGSNYLVAWTDHRNGNADIYATRVSPGGVVLNPAGIAISIASGAQSSSSIAYDGTNSLVVWSDFRNATRDIFGARVSSAGSVLDPTGIGIQTDSFSQFRPSIAFGGGTYLVAWDESGDIWGSRVAPDGAVVDPGGLLISTAPDTQDSPTVAFSGTFLVAWNDRRSGVNYDLYGTRVATDGTVQDSSGLALSTGPTDELTPALTSAPGGWRLVYQRGLGGTGIYLRSVGSK
jgi:hypothetical protein